MDVTKKYITKICGAAQRYAGLRLKSTNIGTSEYECLHYIRKNNGMSQEKLRSFLNVDKAAVTRMVADLEKKGYLYRLQDKKEIFDTGVLMASYFISMLFYDVKITVLSSIFIPLAMVLAEKLKSIIYKYTIAFRIKSSVVANITHDTIENAMLYRANGMEDQNIARYEIELTDLQNKAAKLFNSVKIVYCTYYNKLLGSSKAPHECHFLLFLHYRLPL